MKNCKSLSVNIRQTNLVTLPMINFIKEKCNANNLRISGTKSGWIIFLSIFIIGSIADLWTKAVVFEMVQSSPNLSIPILGDFVRFVTTLNDGAAFNMAAGQKGILIGISVAAFFVILIMVLFSKSNSFSMMAAMGFLVAGITGNLYDRIFNDGLVRDFIEVRVYYWPGKIWPVFNVADSMLCVGVGIIIISSFCGFYNEKHGQRSQES